MIPDEIRARLARAPKKARIALVGASNHPEKYGNIILRDLRRKGFTVLPVNPRDAEIDGLPVAKTVNELDDVDLVNFVVPPAVGLEVMKGMDPARFDCVWFQPGAGSRQTREYAERRFAIVIDGPCIMVET